MEFVKGNLMADPTKKEKIHYTISELKQMVKIIGEMAEGIKEYTNKTSQSIEDMAIEVDKHIKDLQRQIDKNNNEKGKQIAIAIAKAKEKNK